MWPKKVAGQKNLTMCEKLLEKEGFKKDKSSDSDGVKYYRSESTTTVVSIVDGFWESNHAGKLHRGSSGVSSLERLQKWIDEGKPGQD